MGTTMHTVKNEHLRQAMDLYKSGDPEWIGLVQVVLREMTKQHSIPDLLGAAKTLLEEGQTCLAKHAERFDANLRKKGTTLIRFAVDFLAQAGDNEGLIRLANQQADTSLRLSLRCWASLNSEHRWTQRDREKVLDLVNLMKSEVVTHDDVTRIRDAYAALDLREEIVLYAEALETQGHPIWSKMLRTSLDTEPEEEPVAT